MTKRSRAIALITAVALVFGLVFSALFAAQQSAHNCTGEDCVICLSLQQNLKLFDNQSLASNGIIAVLGIAWALCILLCDIQNSAKSDTLISLKEKLSD